MRYKKLKSLLEDYDTERFEENVMDFYGNCSVLNYYLGENWYLGLIRIYSSHYMYIKYNREKLPEYVFKWDGCIEEFDSIIYSNVSVEEDIDNDEAIFIKIMNKYEKLTVGKKYGLK